MKTNKSTATAAFFGTAMVLISPLALGQSNSTAPGQLKKLPVAPVGWLDAYPTIVQSGTHPQIRWGINLPTNAAESITVSNGAITINETCDVECRIIGNGVTAHFVDGSTQQVSAEALVSVNNGTYQSVFSGTNDSVNPNTVVWSASDLKKNQTIQIGGHYDWNNVQGPTYNSSTSNVQVLVNGQLPPTEQPMHTSPSLQSFMTPYLDPASGRVNIGPMDFLVLIELTHPPSQTSNVGYDLQDLVLLFTVKPKGKVNHGHGNNIDGVDSSNPGNAPFIYLDTDPTVDDEGKGGGAVPSKK